MTVTELIEELSKYNGDLLVLQSSDEEGNSFRETYDITLGSWDHDEAWLNESDQQSDVANCLVLWP